MNYGPYTDFPGSAQIGRIHAGGSLGAELEKLASDFGDPGMADLQLRLSRLAEIPFALPAWARSGGSPHTPATAAQIMAQNGGIGTISGASLIPGSVPGDVLGEGEITSTYIADDSISTPKLQANSVIAAKIAANAIESDKIAANAVTAGKIAAGAVEADKIAANAVTAAKIAAGSIETDKIAANAVTAAKIAANTITAGQIAAGAIDTDELAAGAVTAGKIAANTITAAEIAAGAIDTAELAAGAVTAAKIQAGTITATEISSNAITTAKLDASSVTLAKMASSSVDTAQIVAAAITNAKVNDVSGDKISSGTVGNARITGSLSGKTYGANDGSAGAPGIYFDSLSDYGFYSATTDVRVVVNGSTSVQFSLNGPVFSDSGRPGSDNTYDWGSSVFEWNQIYCFDLIESSDGELKDNVKDSPLGLSFIRRLRPVSFRWKDTLDTQAVEDAQRSIEESNVAATVAPWQQRIRDLRAEQRADETTTAEGRARDGARESEIAELRGRIKAAVNAVNEPLRGAYRKRRAGRRPHYGFVAQDVKAALEAEGQDAGFFKQDRRTGRAALRYTGLIAPIVKALQELDARVTALEAT